MRRSSFIARGVFAGAGLPTGVCACPANQGVQGGSADVAPAAGVTTPDPLVAMFVWWNAAYKQKDGFTAASFSRYFSMLNFVSIPDPE